LPWGDNFPGGVTTSVGPGPLTTSWGGDNFPGDDNFPGGDRKVFGGDSRRNPAPSGWPWAWACRWDACMERISSTAAGGGRHRSAPTPACSRGGGWSRSRSAPPLGCAKIALHFTVRRNLRLVFRNWGEALPFCQMMTGPRASPPPPGTKGSTRAEDRYMHFQKMRSVTSKWLQPTCDWGAENFRAHNKTNIRMEANGRGGLVGMAT